LSEVDWGEVYAMIATHTGWPWEYIGEHVTLPRLQHLSKYWLINPPGGHLAAFLGLLRAGETAPAPEPERIGTLDELIGAFTAAGVKVA
jgi:hypothetical protein